MTSDIPPGDSPLCQSFRRGWELLEDEDYHPAHEAFEEAWRLTTGSEKSLCQALVQVAAALHHVTRANSTGAAAVVERCRGHLTKVPQGTLGVDVGGLSELVERFADEVRAWNEGRAAAPLARTVRAEAFKGSVGAGR